MSQKKDIMNYYFFENLFNEEEIKQIEQIAEQKDMEEGTTFGKNSVARRSKIAWLGLEPDTEWLFNKIVASFSEANNNCFQFDWNGETEAIQFTEYDEEYKGHYDWHIDMGPDKQSRKMTAVTFLTDDHEGGKLQLWEKDISKIQKKGNMVIFPSFFLHKVTPVTKGLRKTLVCWANGDAFR